MKDLRFYLEHGSPADKRRKNHNGNVFARFLDIAPRPAASGDDLMVEGVGAAYDRANAAVTTASASTSYLLKNCTRISEARAREIHPNLFSLLDD